MNTKKYLNKHANFMHVDESSHWFEDFEQLLEFLKHYDGDKETLMKYVGNSIDQQKAKEVKVLLEELGCSTCDYWSFGYRPICDKCHESSKHSKR